MDILLGGLYELILGWLTKSIWNKKLSLFNN